MAPKSKEMLSKLFVNVIMNLLLTALVVIVTIAALTYYFQVELQVSSLSLILGIVGATLAFAGNDFVADGLGRYSAHETPQFVWGNRIQPVGFALTLVALLVK